MFNTRAPLHRKPDPRAKRGRNSQPQKLRLEFLEDRTVPTTFTVTGTGDSGTGSSTSGDLRYCITQANANAGADIIDATGISGTITLASALPTITGSVTINGPAFSGAVPLVNIDGDDAFRVFNISGGSGNNGITVTLARLTLRNGNVTGGTAQGGGIRFDGAGSTSANSLTLTLCNLLDNHATAGDDDSAYGGGLYTKNVSVTMTGTTFEDNTVTGGGSDTTGGNAYGGGFYADGSAVTMTGAKYYTNTASGGFGEEACGSAFGGGMYVEGATLTLTDGRFEGNIAAGGGGEGTQVGGFAAGGGLYIGGGSADLNRLFLTENAARGGDALENGLNAMLVAGDADGGGIFGVFEYTSGPFVFTIVDSEINDNTAEGGTAHQDYLAAMLTGGNAAGGGMHIVTTGGGNLTAGAVAIGCTFADNSALGGSATGLNKPHVFGGDAYSGGVTISRMFNCTITGNQALGGYASSDDGITPGNAGGGGFGGLDLTPGAVDGGGNPIETYDIFNCTIASNSAQGGIGEYLGPVNVGSARGGGIDDGHSNLTTRFFVRIYSSIVALNMVNSNDPNDPIGTGGEGPDIWGGDTLGHNLVGYGDASSPNFQGTIFGNQVVPNANDDLVGPDGFGDVFDPLLNSLATNGGPTQTLSLQSNSPAIDNGANAVGVNGQLTYDQRGLYYVRSYTQPGGNPINFLDGTDVGAFEKLPAATVVYADRLFDGLDIGDVISDADPITGSSQAAIFGYNAFDSVNDAIAAGAVLFVSNPTAGLIIVNGYDGSTSGTGDFAEDVVVSTVVPVLLQSGRTGGASHITLDSLEIGPDGKVTLAALSGYVMTLFEGGITSYGSFYVQGGPAYATRTEVINDGTLFFGAGSYTEIGGDASHTNLIALFDQGSDNLDLIGASGTGNGAVLRNNGGDEASGGGVRGANVIVGAYGLAKGIGFYNGVKTENGGVYSPGNSPGSAFISALNFGPGGIGGYLFEISNATGAAGATSGWDLVNTDDFTWSASGEDKLNFSLSTIVNSGSHETGGAMDNFNPSQSYSWAVVHWTGTYSGPADVTLLNAATIFDTSGFANSFSGSFGWNLDLGASTLYVTYTPAP